MKRVLKKFLVCILIVMIATNFAWGTFIGNVAHAALFTNDAGEVTPLSVIGGLVGLIARIPAIILMALAMAVNGLLSAFVAIGTGRC